MRRAPSVTLAAFFALVACAPGSAPSDAGLDAHGADEDAASPDARDAAPTPTEPISTAAGPVIGRRGGDGITRFLGIPYAAPPTGSLRFRPTQPHDAWSAPREAAAFGAWCPQAPVVSFGGAQPFDEDCLTLNVWTPSTAATAHAPVMVFVHGGSFLIGSGAQPTYDGAELARHGVVVVTFNYRLGPLGFLAHPGLAAEDAQHGSGNYGLYDQLAALAWVRDNIGAFGGDRANVTVFGESAGSISVCSLLFAPRARGLFQHAILQSGTCNGRLVPFVVSHAKAEQRGAATVQSVGCGSASDVPACLRALPAERLIPTGRLVNVGQSAEDTLPTVPSVDGVVLPALPLGVSAPAQIADADVIVGFNHDEFTLFTRLITPPLTVPDASAYTAEVRRAFGTDAEALLALYPVTDFRTPLEAFERMMRDVAFACPTRALARTLSTAGRRVRVYHFTHVPAFYAAAGVGATHAADLDYAFGNFVAPVTNPTASDRTLSALMVDGWTRFARTGDPTGGLFASWPAFSRAMPAYVDLAPVVTDGTGAEFAHCDAVDAIEGR